MAGQRAEEGTVPTGQTAAKAFLKVVLTGGPSSGKSSALALLRDRLSARGFQVLTVPENATHFLANSDGFQPEWAGTTSQVKMQRIFLNYQMAQEQAFLDFANLHPTKPAVLLLDCCTINSKVYLSEEQWQKVLTLPGEAPLTEDRLFARYDLVIHMVTCAMHGHYEWGPGSNNPGRYHSPEQAKEMDERCLKVFSGHSQVRVVPHYEDFDDKIGKVVEFVNDALHIEGLVGKRRRRRCHISDFKAMEALVGLPSSSGSLVTSTFLDEQMQHSVRRNARIPARTCLDHIMRFGADAISAAAPTEEAATDVLYERRTKVECPKSPSMNYLTRKAIKEEDYVTALSCAGTAAASITKRVLRFVLDGHYYELFSYASQGDLVLDFGAGAPSFPEFLQVTGCRDLTREDSEALVGKTSLDGTATPASKKRRLLRPHSTEEAAAQAGS